METNGKKQLIIIFVLVMFLMSISFAYFLSDFSVFNNSDEVSTRVEDLSFTFNSGSAISLSKSEPGNSSEKTFTLENTGDNIIKYNLVWKSVNNTYIDQSDLVYVLTCTASSGNCNGKTETVLPSTGTNIELLSSQTIPSGVTYTYTITISFLETNDDQSDNMNKMFSSEIGILPFSKAFSKGSFVVLDNSYGWNLFDYNIYGNSVQEGTPTILEPIEIQSLGDNSNNLFYIGNTSDYFVNNYSGNMDFRVENNELSSNGQGSSTSYIINNENIFSSGTYTISFSSLLSSRFIIRCFDNTGTLINNSSLSITGMTYNSYYKGWYKDIREYTFTIPDSVSYWQIGFMFGNDLSQRYSISDIQIEKGTNKTEYRPFRYIDVNIGAKNLYDIPYIDKDTELVTIPCNITEPITINANNDNLSFSELVWRFRIKYQDGSFSYVMDIGLNSSFPKTFNASNENPIIEITYRGIMISDGMYNDILIEKGSIATSFQHYQSPIVTIDLTYYESLRKIGDVADYINYGDGKIKRYIGKINSYNGESISTDYMSTTGSLTTGATVYYVLPVPTEELITLPEIPTVEGTSKLRIENTPTASNMEVSYCNH